MGNRTAAPILFGLCFFQFSFYILGSHKHITHVDDFRQRDVVRRAAGLVISFARIPFDAFIVSLLQPLRHIVCNKPQRRYSAFQFQFWAGGRAIAVAFLPTKLLLNAYFPLQFSFVTKGEGKVVSCQRHEGIRGKQRCSSTHS
jgi:hypothetical protein